MLQLLHMHTKQRAVKRLLHSVECLACTASRRPLHVFRCCGGGALRLPVLGHERRAPHLALYALVCLQFPSRVVDFIRSGFPASPKESLRCIMYNCKATFSADTFGVQT
eukprot:gnl/MRDRNA2_/MRDRNA2_62275_c0_seq1.p2 gnl/MRDRNA2_/MRDRNA2_62275_c0~~gnl/MRDRNA2_/MRDRNA2_62275_c0_seq1.p2  ORF type:complete len:109 (-),score=9.35 gnl/MRDRNA2_/MRDRNA2_62275_c0_seq1:211-537(-)